MSWIEAAILGALQGLTEFLPVSSSGHLRIGQWVMDVFFSQSAEFTPDPLFEIYLHGITLLVVLAVFRDRLISTLKNRPMVIALGLSAVSTTVLVKGLGLDDRFENALITAVFLGEIATGVFLLLGEHAARQGKEEKKLLWQAALIIGLAQGVAVMPGISRSGSTIACALLLGWQREKAFDFAFLMSIPVIGGVMLLKTKDVITEGLPVTMSFTVLLAGALPAAILGYLTLVGLRKWVQTSLRPFAYYCLILGVVGCAYEFLRP